MAVESSDPKEIHNVGEDVAGQASESLDVHGALASGEATMDDMKQAASEGASTAEEAAKATEEAKKVTFSNQRQQRKPDAPKPSRVKSFLGFFSGKKAAEPAAATKAADEGEKKNVEDVIKEEDEEEAEPKPEPQVEPQTEPKAEPQELPQAEAKPEKEEEGGKAEEEKPKRRSLLGTLFHHRDSKSEAEKKHAPEADERTPLEGEPKPDTDGVQASGGTGEGEGGRITDDDGSATKEHPEKKGFLSFLKPRKKSSQSESGVSTGTEEGAEKAGETGGEAVAKDMPEGAEGKAEPAEGAVSDSAQEPTSKTGDKPRRKTLLGRLFSKKKESEEEKGTETADKETEESKGPIDTIAAGAAVAGAAAVGATVTAVSAVTGDDAKHEDGEDSAAQKGGDATNEAAMAKPEEASTQPEEMAKPDEMPAQPEEVLTQPEEIPAQQEEMPVQQEEMPAQPEEMPVQPEEIPAQPEEILAQPEEIPAQQEEILAQPEEMPAQQEEIPAQQEEIPAQQEEMSAQPEEIPAQQEEILAQPEEMPAQQEEIPAQQEEIPAQQEEIPVQEEAPAKTETPIQAETPVQAEETPAQPEKTASPHPSEEEALDVKEALAQEPQSLDEPNVVKSGAVQKESHFFHKYRLRHLRLMSDGVLQYDKSASFEKPKEVKLDANMAITATDSTSKSPHPYALRVHPLNEHPVILAFENKEERDSWTLVFTDFKRRLASIGPPLDGQEQQVLKSSNVEEQVEKAAAGTGQVPADTQEGQVAA